MERRAFLLASLAPLAVRRAGAQETPTFSTGVKVVNVLVGVREKNGKSVQNLTQNDFAIEEDSHPQAIRYFSRQTDLPLTIGLVVDTSGSVSSVLEDERQASFRFLDQVLRPDRDKAFVIHFDREVELLQDLTSSKTELKQALDLLEAPGRFVPQRILFQGGGFPFPIPGIPQPRGGGGGGGRRGGPQSPGGRGNGGRAGRGGSALYDAVLLASDELMRKQEGRKALIVMSDGEDTGSKTSLTSAIEAAQRADTIICSIWFQGRMGAIRGGQTNGKSVLERMSEETGGGFFEAGDKLPFSKIFAQIEEDLRNQYNLGYVSDQDRKGFRPLKVSVKGNGRVVRARAGYYAGD